VADLSNALNAALNLYHSADMTAMDRLCQQILAVAPNHPDALHLAALAAQGVGDHDRALPLARAAVTLHPESLLYHVTLAGLLALMSHPAEAEQEYRLILRQAPDNVACHLGLADALVHQGDTIAAEQILRTMPPPTLPGEQIAASLIYERIGCVSDALALARAAYNDVPHIPESRIRLAECLVAAGALEEAAPLLTACLAEQDYRGMVRLDFAALLHRTGQNDKAILLLRLLVSEQPKNVEALCYLGSLLLDAGHLAEAESALRACRKLQPDHIQAGFNHGLALQKLGADREAIAVYRHVLALNSHFEDARINLLVLLAETGERGLWSDLTNDAKPAGQRRQLYVLCFPKSGSTFLCTMLEKLTGLRMSVLTQGYQQNEQELDRGLMFRMKTEEYVVHQHTRATFPNLHLLQAFDIRPVILVRNLADALVSMVDYLAKGAYASTFFGPRYAEWPRERQIDAAIARYGHWYIEFFASWTRVQRDGALDCCFVHYEDMITDKPGTLLRVARFLGLGNSDADITQAALLSDGAQTRTLFNKGISGRGQRDMSPAQLLELERLARFYPDIDFRPIGLASCPDALIQTANFTSGR